MKTISIEFTPEQMQTLNDALIELPFRKAAPLVAHINAQIQRAHDIAADAADRATGAPMLAE